ncbi:MAG: hypothetical protein IBX68_06095 [Dehalococcoidia bacterium]|nr:hypothetical protein [Dehalococcoidia bacterium]
MSFITDRKKVEDHLRQNEHQYRLLAENMADVMRIIDLDMRLTFVNYAFDKRLLVTP